MNRKQMIADFDRLGGKTKLNAIRVSIKHWKMIGHVRYWERLKKEANRARTDGEIYPGYYNCGLCYHYDDNCAKCGLGKTRFSCGCCPNYQIAAGGIKYDDRKQFLRGRRGLLKELAVLEAKERDRLERKKK